MEVRCGSCNKLFRVSDDKITGSGIKFTCTRCGEHVKITKEDLEHYSLSKSTVSVLDLFDPKQKPGPEQATPEEPQVSTGDIDNAFAETGAVGSTPAEQQEPNALFAEQAPTFEEPTAAPDTLAEATFPHAILSTEMPAAEQDVAPEDRDQIEPMPVTQVVSSETAPTNLFTTPTPQPAVIETEPQPVVTQSTRVAEPEAQPVAAKTAVKETPAAPAMPPREVKPEPVKKITPSATPATPVSPKPMPKKPPVRPSLPASEKAPRETISATRDSGRSRLFISIISVVIVICLSGYGIYYYTGSSRKIGTKISGGLVATDGLSISNAAGSVETDGDLLITGVVENTTDKERSNWYIVVDVFDARGTVLAKLKMLNGKQLYTRKEFEVLAKRGKNVLELKAKLTQESGVSIPAKSTAPFEIRYIQPPVGVASFNAVLHPFDPLQVRKEIISEIN